MTQEQAIEQLAQEMGRLVGNLNDKVGINATLTTNNNDNIVAAVNELNSIVIALNTGHDNVIQALTNFFNVVLPNSLIKIPITNKGNNDIIIHNLYTNLSVLSFQDIDDGKRIKPVFFNSDVTTSQFTLRNDFTNDKFNGILLCIKD